MEHTNTISGHSGSEAYDKATSVCCGYEERPYPEAKTPVKPPIDDRQSETYFIFLICNFVTFNFCFGSFFSKFLPNVKLH